MKKIILFLVISAVAATTYGFESRVNVANIDSDTRVEIIKNGATPPVVNEQYAYYEISGETANELRRQMSRNGIKWDDGNTYDALTTWNVKWDYEYNCSLQGCTADGFKPVVDITFRYPKWARTNAAPEPLAAKWDAYMKNLITHENGHRDMAVEAAAQLSRIVAELPPAPSRTELDRKIEAVTGEWIAKLNTDEKNYDSTTVHGATQGAVFP